MCTDIVYLVWYSDKWDSRFYGVYSTKEKAQERLDEIKKSYRPNDWTYLEINEQEIDNP